MSKTIYTPNTSILLRTKYDSKICSPICLGIISLEFRLAGQKCFIRFGAAPNYISMV